MAIQHSEVGVFFGGRLIQPIAATQTTAFLAASMLGNRMDILYRKCRHFCISVC